MAFGLSSLETKAAYSLATIFAIRMLGLFMIMPVFALYGAELAGYSPLWVGLAIGAYGLTQAVMQIPMGLASDRYGRKPVIYFGLLLFVVGSVVAALSDSVYGVTVGRALQGMGAISSVVMALAADLTRDEQRPKVMALIGMFIGIAFAVALVAGPILAAQLHLSGLFWVTAGLAVVAFLLTRFTVPNAISFAPKGDVVPIPSRLKALIADPQLSRLNMGIFSLHLLMTAMFVALPGELVRVGYQPEQHWHIYLPTLLLSFVLMIPMLIISAKKRNSRGGVRASQLLLFVSLMGFAFAPENLLVVTGIVVFFTGFNYLEATLPTLIARFAPAGAKGSAMGIYASSQFFGAFCGGLLGGVVMQFFTPKIVFLVAACLVLLWAVFAWGMSEAGRYRSVTLDVAALLTKHDGAVALAEQLRELPGVKEVTIVAEEGITYLKVDETFELAPAKALLAGS
ncbi:MFS transporter [Corallincola luteus]|uniref:MFS transporter n=1 Tax=Corallincola luteus TaxID=1775177 RepID=A0ABY2AKQ4_9GAMM|nr:MFS transporter [Corallincola luteus]TCI03508.1 MFS transporter [Corallincola luteus]